MVPGSTLLFLTVCLVRVAQSVPVESFPINAQLPPVARPSQPFSFTFSTQTFTSQYSISYALADAPAWLSLDGDARRIYGTPGDQSNSAGESQSVTFGLIATDQSGSTTANSTLAVSSDPVPTIQVPLDDQIIKLGNYSAPSSILFSPSASFSFSFASDTFKAGGSANLSYYAVCDNYTPLPAWIQFESDTLTFSGTTPPLESPNQAARNFPLRLVSSDVAGFAAINAPFSIVVASHKLATSTSLITLNATRGSPFSYANLSQLLSVDDKAANPNDIQSVSPTGLPGWLQFDNTTWAFTGTPDQAAQSTDVNVTIVDTFSDSLNIVMAINIIADNSTLNSTLFKSSLPSVNLTGGGQLSLDLSTYLYNSTDDNVAIDVNTASAWVTYNASTMQISGSVPPNSTLQSISVLVHAQSKTTGAQETQTLQLNIAPGGISSTTSIPAPTSSVIPTGPAATTSLGPAENGAAAPNSVVNKALLAVLLPALFIVVALLVIFLIWRAKHKGSLSSKHEQSDDDYLPTSMAYGPSPPPVPDIPPQLQREVNSSQPGPALYRNFSAKTPPRKPSADEPVPPRPDSADEHSLPSSGLPTALVRSVRKSLGIESKKTEPVSQPDTQPQLTLFGSATSTGETLLTMSTRDEAGRSISVPARSTFRFSSGSESIPPSPNLRHSPLLGVNYFPQPPSSIQHTPHVAYMGGDQGSTDSLNRVSIKQSGQWTVFPRRSKQSGEASPGLLSPNSIGKRLSNAWKRGIGSPRIFDDKRKSALSSSTLRTSDISSQAAGQPITSPAEARILSKPTIIHISSKPSITGAFDEEARPSDSWVKDETAKPPPLFQSPPHTSRGVGTSSGVTQKSSTVSHFLHSDFSLGDSTTFITDPDSDNWVVLHPRSNVAWSPTTTGGSSSIESPIIPAQDNISFDLGTGGKYPSKGKGRARGHPGSPKGSPARSASSGRSGSPQDFQEEKLRISRIREEKTLKSFRVKVAESTSTIDKASWKDPDSPSLPHISISHDYDSFRLGTADSSKSQKTHHSVYHDAKNEGDDVWEDVVPDGSGQTGGQHWASDSNHSFAAYI